MNKTEKPIGYARLVLNYDGGKKYSSAEVLDREFIRYGLKYWEHEKHGFMVDDDYREYVDYLSDMSKYNYLYERGEGFYEVVGEFYIDSFQCNHPLDPVEWDMNIWMENIKIQRLKEEQIEHLWEEELLDE